MSIDDNLRWALMNKVIMLILETCDQVKLSEILIENMQRFEESLKKPFRDFEQDPTLFYMLVKEK